MDSQNMLLLVLSLLLTTYVFLFGFLKKVNDWYYISMMGENKHLLPPGTMGWPLIGNMWSYIKAYRAQNPDSFISNLVTRYEKTGIYKTHLFFRPAIIVCNSEICRKVLLNSEHFEMGYPASIKLIFGKGALHNVSISKHKFLRKLIVAPICGHDALSVYVGYVEEIVVKGLDELASMDRPIEFLNEIKIISFKIITQIFIGSSVGSIDLMSTEKCYTDMFNGLMSFAINIPGSTFHKAMKSRKVLVKILQSVLDERKVINRSNDVVKKKGMIDFLMETEDETGKKLEDEEIIDLLLAFLLAGHATTANVAMWATMNLHNNPEILQKAKEEQVEILKKRPPSQKGLTVHEVRQMEYLAKVIDETLRKLGSSLIFREAKEDVSINGYLIPKGWKVLLWSKALHMDPENYPNPKDFNPSRWDNQKPKIGSFIPFGAGSRICPGADLAKIEIAIFLHYFLLNYKFEQVNPEGPMVYFPMLKPANNCLAKVIKLP